MRSLRVAVFLASRSILRGNRGIMLMSILMLCLVYINLLFIPSLLKGATDQADRQLRHTFTADLTVTAVGKAGIITDATATIDDILKIDGVEAATSVYRAGNYIAYDDKSGSWPVEAIEPSSYHTVFTDNITEGDFLNDDDKDKIVLGAAVAGNGIEDKRGYEGSLRTVPIGSTVTATIGQSPSTQVEVTGIFYDQFVLADQRAFITMATLEQYLPMADNKATSIYVKIADGADANTILSSIENLEAGLDAKLPEEIAGFVKDQADTISIINRILSVISFLVAAITVFIVTYVDLVNRRKQIGIERAIGITNSSLILSYIMRALVYTVIGVGIGALLYLFIIIPFFERYPFSFPGGPVSLSVQYVLMRRYGLILLVVALLAALLPSWQSVRIKLLDAIWGVT